MRVRLNVIPALMAAIVVGLLDFLSAQAASSDRDILIELFEATGGRNWKRQSGWGSDRPICSWEGVVCGFFAESGPVTRLELWDNNLRGVVPESLAKLTELKVLNFPRTS
jgi:hypothetical protein